MRERERERERERGRYQRRGLLDLLALIDGVSVDARRRLDRWRAWSSALETVSPLPWGLRSVYRYWIRFRLRRSQLAVDGIVPQLRYLSSALRDLRWHAPDFSLEALDRAIMEIEGLQLEAAGAAGHKPSRPVRPPA